LYGRENWCLTLREERILRVFENRVLRIIFGPQRDEVTGGWRKLRNEELHSLCTSPNIIRVIKSKRMRLSRNVARMGKIRNAFNILARKPEGNGPLVLGRLRRTREDSIKMDLMEIGFRSVD
jgi:hypothetical protein